MVAARGLPTLGAAIHGGRDRHNLQSAPHVPLAILGGAALVAATYPASGSGRRKGELCGSSRCTRRRRRRVAEQQRRLLDHRITQNGELGVPAGVAGLPRISIRRAAAKGAQTDISDCREAARTRDRAEVLQHAWRRAVAQRTQSSALVELLPSRAAACSASWATGAARAAAPTADRRTAPRAVSRRHSTTRDASKLSSRTHCCPRRPVCRDLRWRRRHSERRWWRSERHRWPQRAHGKSSLWKTRLIASVLHFPLGIRTACIGRDTPREPH